MTNASRKTTIGGTTPTKGAFQYDERFPKNNNCGNDTNQGCGIAQKPHGFTNDRNRRTNII